MLQKYGWAISLFIVLVLVILGIVIIVNRSYDELADQSTNFEETQDGTENQNLSGLSKPSPEIFTPPSDVPEDQSSMESGEQQQQGE